MVQAKFGRSSKLKASLAGVQVVGCTISAINEQRDSRYSESFHRSCYALYPVETHGVPPRCIFGRKIPSCSIKASTHTAHRGGRFVRLRWYIRLSVVGRDLRRNCRLQLFRANYNPPRCDSVETSYSSQK